MFSVYSSKVYILSIIIVIRIDKLIPTIKSSKVYYIGNQLLQYKYQTGIKAYAPFDIFVHLWIKGLSTFTSKSLCTLVRSFVHLLCAQLSRDTNHMYPSFQECISVVSLLFALICPHKLIHILLVSMCICIVCIHCIIAKRKRQK